MTTLEIVAGFWLAGSLLAMWKIWKPSIKVISLIDKENILVQRPILSTIIVFVIFTIFLPFMVFLSASKIGVFKPCLNSNLLVLI